MPVKNCEVVIISLFYCFINSYTIPTTSEHLQSHITVGLPLQWPMIHFWTAQLGVHALKYLWHKSISGIKPAYNLLDIVNSRLLIYTSLFILFYLYNAILCVIGVFGSDSWPWRALDTLIMEFELRYCACHVSKVSNIMTHFVAPSLTMAPYVMGKVYSNLAGLQVLHAGFFNFYLIASADLKIICISPLI